MKKSALRLPKLKTRDELLRTAPELGRLLVAAGDADAGGPLAAAPRSRSPGPPKRGSPAVRRPGVGRRVSADEMTEEEHVRAELERVKAERAQLLASLAKLRADAGKSGGELQQEDIRLLRRELEAKQEKLNELRRATHGLTDALEALQTESRDCEALMPAALPALEARLGGLEGELAGVERDQLEAEAKHELYKLLEVRTRRDHAASEQRMREARALKEGAADDFTALTKQMHEMRAAREDAERALGGVVAVYDQVRADWHRKLRDRRKEVRELERRRAEEAQRKEAAAAALADKARAEADKSARSKAERDAANARLSAVVPELEALEASWARLHGICGAATADDLIAYWQELKAKEASMRELVRLAEAREARAKAEMDALLAARAEVFDTETARGARKDAGAAAALAQTAGSAAGEGLQAAQTQAEKAQQASEDGVPAAALSEGDAPPQAGDEQGVEAVADLESTGGLQQVTAPAGVADGAAAPLAAEAQQPEEEGGAATEPQADAEVELRLKQAAIAEARRRKATARDKFAKLSQICVAADQGLHLMALRLKAALEPAVGGDRRRTSMAGSRRVTAQHGRRVTGRRVSAANLADRRGSIATMALHGAAADASPREAAGAGIRDRDFFPELPSLLSDVGGRLSRLLGLVGELEAAAAASAAGPPQVAVGSAASGEGSLDSSLAVTEASEAAVAAARTASARKLKWADGEGAPGVGGEAAQGGEGEGGESSGGDEEGGDAAAGERSLRKGFKRHTWAGPAWLDTVGTGKPLTATLRKQLGGRAAAPPSSPLRRVVGQVEEGAEDEGATNPFDLASSDEDEGAEAGGGVVDRQYLKHRAQKLLRARAKAAAAQVDTR